MRFVEAIARKFVDQVEQLVRLFCVDLVGLAPLDEACALRVHFRLDLLAHRAAQQIGIAQRKPGKHLCRLHHLFLIDEHAIGLGKNPFEQGMGIFDGDTPVLAVAEQRNVVHRSRTIK